MENAHTPQWPEIIHAINDWHCKMCSRDVNFECRHELEEHIRICHDIKDSDQIALRMEGSFHTHSRRKGVCPLCNVSVTLETSTPAVSLTHGEGTLNAISTHVARHLEDLASPSFRSIEHHGKSVESGGSASMVRETEEVLDHLPTLADDEPALTEVGTGLEQSKGTWLSN